MAKGPRATRTRLSVKTKGKAPTGAARSSTRLNRREANTAVSSMGTVQTKALSWIIDYLRDNQDEILMCKGMLENGQCSPNAVSDSAAEKEAFHYTYVSFKSLPKYWIAEWLVTTCRFAPAFVDLIDAGGSSQVRQVFTYFTGVGEHSYWPRPLLRKELLVKFLAEMLDKLGKRHEGFDQFVDRSGKVKWSEVGPYKLDWKRNGNEVYVEKITHTSGASIKMDAVRITQKFGLQEPWDDLRAQFCGDVSIKPIISELFPKDVPFKKMLSKAGMVESATAIESEWLALQARQVKGEQQILKTAKANQAAAAKAKSRTRAPACKVVTPLVVNA